MRISDWSSDVCSSDVVKLLEDAGDNQRQTEGQEQSVEMVEMVEPPYQQALQHDADRADDDWSEQQGPPIADAEIGQQHPGGERAQHVLRAMSEVNDEIGRASCRERVCQYV